MDLELYYYAKHNLELLKSIFKKRNFIYTMNTDIFFKEYSFIFNQSIISLSYNTDDVELKDYITATNAENNVNTNTKLNIELNDNYFCTVLVEFIDELISRNITDIILIDEYENIIFKRNNNTNIIEVTSNFPFNLLKCNYDKGVYLSYIIKLSSKDYTLENVQQIVFKIINSYQHIISVDTSIIYEKYFSTEIFSFSISTNRIIIKYLYNFNNKNQLDLIHSIIFEIISNFSCNCTLNYTYGINQPKNNPLKLVYNNNTLKNILWNIAHSS